ncbi:MAG TPA: LysR family transcriptional regulator [Acetobacteraceae bacterium]|nr:LysR family transcriptional regulator [Acetobacteraceae bacterium]
MDLRQLEYFIAVATEQNFTRAAARLHMVQSGLSASIRALEDELGAALFIRTTRRVEVTPTGRAFLVEARRVLAAAATARQVVDEMCGLQRGTLSVGMIQGLAPLLEIADLLGRFRAACPHVEVRLTSGGSLPLIEGVRGGELDLAFTQFVGAVPPGVSAWMLACEPLVAVCAPGHWLAGQKTVALPELIKENFVDLHPDWGTRQLIDQSFEANRLARRTSFEVNDLPTQLDLVAHGLGIALVPEAVIADYAKANAAKPVRAVELAEPEICWELAAVFAHDANGKPSSAVTEALLGLLQDGVTILEKTAG